jgi:uncharacterized protein (DUF1778 family)
MQHKAEQLQIRTTVLQKTKLAEAARVLNMNVSQFVLNTSLEAAENVLADQTRMSMGETAFAEFSRLLDEPPVPLDSLKAQFAKLQRG